MRTSHLSISRQNISVERTVCHSHCPYLFCHDNKNWDVTIALLQPRMSLDLTASSSLQCWCPEDSAIPPHALPSTPPRSTFCQRLEVMPDTDVPCLYMLFFSEFKKKKKTRGSIVFPATQRKVGYFEAFLPSLSI